jgi:hypothetical protein
MQTKQKWGIPSDSSLDIFLTELQKLILSRTNRKKKTQMEIVSCLK